MSALSLGDQEDEIEEAQRQVGSEIDEPDLSLVG